MVHFDSSDGVYAWFSSFINLERGLGGKPGEHFRLDRMRTLAGLAGNPEHFAPVIHVAGSKGKGSVTALTAAILESAGKKTARYMSPHVSDWRERVSAGGDFFPEQTYTGAGNELAGVYGAYRKHSLFESSGEPTFFELITLYFFLCARKTRREVFVVETGIGGTLDATNIVDPLVSLITVIEKEHTEYLGGDCATIAGEKAGIIKNGKPVIAAKQNRTDVEEVFRKTAREKNAPFFYVPECCSLSETELNGESVSFSLGFNKAGYVCRQDIFPGGLSARYTMPVPSAVQAENAALAIMAAKMAHPSLDAQTVRKALAGFSLPARFERFSCAVDGTEITLVVDGAHTPASVEQCARTFVSLYGTGGVLLFACAADKDADTLSRVLVPHFSRCIITAPGSFRAADPETACAAFLAAAESDGKAAAISLIPGTETAVKTAARYASENALPLLACGSFYLAGELRKYLEL